ncbi:MAG: helix-turn-helix domain-containing protein [Myxococcota bacterium]
MTQDEQSSRVAILGAARTLFAERGFEDTSTRAIVEASGTSKGSFYHFFSSKEDLYAAVLEEMIDELWAADFEKIAEGAVDRDTYWRTIAQATQRSADRMLAQPEHMRLWRGFQKSWRLIGDAGPARRLREKNLRMGERLAALGQRIGCIRVDISAQECAQLVESVDAVADGWFFDWADQIGSRAAFEKSRPLTLDLIWRMLASPDDLDNGSPATFAPPRDGETR